MENLLFTLLLALVFGAAIRWGSRRLPDESWQFFAAVPGKKNGGGGFHGTNLTWYGILSAGAQVLGVAAAVFLLGSVGFPGWAMLLFVGALLGVCVPAASLVARVVEKKRHTFTVGGASFVGVILAPWIAWAGCAAVARYAGRPAEVLWVVAAMSTAYALGEGMGRLACMSFGCCYGKPMDQVPPLVRRLLARTAFVFTGETKKISYAHGLSGVPVVPVQAMTAWLYTGTGLVCTYLFLEGFFGTAFFLSVFVTQLWRLGSEFLRADYRGGGKITAYQGMTIVAVLYAALVPLVFPADAGVAPVLRQGLHALWRPGVILGLQALFLGLFLNVGRSRTTASTLTFHVVRGRI